MLETSSRYSVKNPCKELLADKVVLVARQGGEPKSPPPRRRLRH